MKWLMKCQTVQHFTFDGCLLGIALQPGVLLTCTQQQPAVLPKYELVLSLMVLSSDHAGVFPASAQATPLPFQCKEINATRLQMLLQCPLNQPHKAFELDLGTWCIHIAGAMLHVLLNTASLFLRAGARSTRKIMSASVHLSLKQALHRPRAWPKKAAGVVSHCPVGQSSWVKRSSWLPLTLQCCFILDMLKLLVAALSTTCFKTRVASILPGSRKPKIGLHQFRPGGAKEAPAFLCTLSILAIDLSVVWDEQFFGPCAASELQIGLAVFGRPWPFDGWATLAASIAASCCHLNVTSAMDCQSPLGKANMHAQLVCEVDEVLNRALQMNLSWNPNNIVAVRHFLCVRISCASVMTVQGHFWHGVKQRLSGSLALRPHVPALPWLELPAAVGRLALGLFSRCCQFSAPHAKSALLTQQPASSAFVDFVSFKTICLSFSGRSHRASTSKVPFRSKITVLQSAFLEPCKLHAIFCPTNSARLSWHVLRILTSNVQAPTALAQELPANLTTPKPLSSDGSAAAPRGRQARFYKQSSSAWTHRGAESLALGPHVPALPWLELPAAVGRLALGLFSRCCQFSAPRAKSALLTQQPASSAFVDFVSFKTICLSFSGRSHRASTSKVLFSSKITVLQSAFLEPCKIHDIFCPTNSARLSWHVLRILTSNVQAPTALAQELPANLTTPKPLSSDGSAAAPRGRQARFSSSALEFFGHICGEASMSFKFCCQVELDAPLGESSFAGCGIRLLTFSWRLKPISSFIPICLGQAFSILCAKDFVLQPRLRTACARLAVLWQPILPPLGVYDHLCGQCSAASSLVLVDMLNLGLFFKSAPSSWQTSVPPVSLQPTMFRHFAASTMAVFHYRVPGKKVLPFARAKLGELCSHVHHSHGHVSQLWAKSSERPCDECLSRRFISRAVISDKVRLVRSQACVQSLLLCPPIVPCETCKPAVRGANLLVRIASLNVASLLRCPGRATLPPSAQERPSLTALPAWVLAAVGGSSVPIRGLIGVMLDQGQQKEVFHVGVVQPLQLDVSILVLCLTPLHCRRSQLEKCHEIFQSPGLQAPGQASPPSSCTRLVQALTVPFREIALRQPVQTDIGVQLLQPKHAIAHSFGFEILTSRKESTISLLQCSICRFAQLYWMDFNAVALMQRQPTLVFNVVKSPGMPTSKTLPGRLVQSHICLQPQSHRRVIQPSENDVDLQRVSVQQTWTNAMLTAGAFEVFTHEIFRCPGMWRERGGLGKSGWMARFRWLKLGQGIAKESNRFQDGVGFGNLRHGVPTRTPLKIAAYKQWQWVQHMKASYLLSIYAAFGIQCSEQGVQAIVDVLTHSTSVEMQQPAVLPKSEFVASLMVFSFEYAGGSTAAARARPVPLQHNEAQLQMQLQCPLVQHHKAFELDLGVWCIHTVGAMLHALLNAASLSCTVSAHCFSSTSVSVSVRLSLKQALHRPKAWPKKAAGVVSHRPVGQSSWVKRSSWLPLTLQCCFILDMLNLVLASQSTRTACFKTRVASGFGKPKVGLHQFRPGNAKEASRFCKSMLHSHVLNRLSLLQVRGVSSCHVVLKMIMQRIRTGTRIVLNHSVALHLDGSLWVALVRCLRVPSAGAPHIPAVSMQPKLLNRLAPFVMVVAFPSMMPFQRAHLVNAVLVEFRSQSLCYPCVSFQPHAAAWTTCAFRQSECVFLSWVWQVYLRPWQESCPMMVALCPSRRFNSSALTLAKARPVLLQHNEAQLQMQLQCRLIQPREASELDVGVWCIHIAGAMLHALLNAASRSFYAGARSTLKVKPASVRMILEQALYWSKALLTKAAGVALHCRGGQPVCLRQTAAIQGSYSSTSFWQHLPAQAVRSSIEVSLAFFEGGARVGQRQQSQGQAAFFDLLKFALSCHVAPVEEVLRSGGIISIWSRLLSGTPKSGLILAGHSLGAALAHCLAEHLQTCGVKVRGIVGLEPRGVPRKLLEPSRGRDDAGNSVPQSLTQAFASHMRAEAYQLNFQVSLAPVLSLSQRAFALNAEMAKNGLYGPVAFNDADHFTLLTGYAWDIALRIRAACIWGGCQGF